MYKSIEEIIVLVKAFETQTLLKHERTHTAFLIVGLYYCIRFPFGTAIEKMRNSIYSLNPWHSRLDTAESVYHETLTVFWMITVKQFLETSKHCNIADLANELIACCGDENLPFQYYSRELLCSTDAHNQHVQPDLDRFYLFANLAKLTTRVDGEKTLRLY